MSKRRKDKADDGRKAGAGLGLGNRWKSIDFKTAEAEVSRLQARIAKAVEQGKPNKVIARELDIAEGTVKAHLSLAYRTLGVHNRTEAVFAAAKLGLHPHPFEQD